MIFSNFRLIRISMALALAACLWLLPGSADALAAKRLLVLHSYHKGLAWTDSVDQGLGEALAGRRGELEVYTEHLDAKRFPEYAHGPGAARLLAEKYPPGFLDAVVVSDEDAFQFMLREHDALFPGVPVVFCGLNYFEASMIESRRALYTGVVEAYDVRATLAEALRLHPGARRIVVVNDASPTGLSNRKTLAEVLPEFQERVGVLSLGDQDLDELLARVRGLSPTDVVLLMTFNRDRSGRVIEYEESARLISAAADQAGAPVYGVWDFYLGKGIVGGKLTSGRDQGRVAAAMALAVLDGAAPESVPVVTASPSRFAFDYARLLRFGVPLSALPHGSEVINEPVSFYRQYKRLVWSVGAVFVCLTGLLAALLVNIAGRKRTEAELRRSEEKFETVFRHSPDWIAILRYPEGRYVDVNEAFETITGYTRTEVLGKTSLEIGIYANPEERYEIDPRFLEEGRTHNQEVRYRLKSGEVITVERSGGLVEIGGQQCIVSVVRDVTSKRKAEQAEKESERQRKLRGEAELKMLQAQINPHFLFNALGTIMHHARTSPDTAYELLGKLSDFFRKNIRPGGASVALAKEIEHCRDYVALEQARFEERLSVAYAVDPRALDCKVPPLILQPLVENALKHGVLRKEEGGRIEIGARRGDGGVEVWVRDDGVGMDAAAVAAALGGGAPMPGGGRGSGMALVNVNARLRAVFGEDAGLRIESRPGRGARVAFRVPCAVAPGKADEAGGPGEPGEPGEEGAA